MDIRIANKETTKDSVLFELETEKKSAFIGINKKENSINVICKNAMHRAFGMNGRTFWSVEDALNGYKSPEMKSMIKLAVELS